MRWFIIGDSMHRIFDPDMEKNTRLGCGRASGDGFGTGSGSGAGSARCLLDSLDTPGFGNGDAQGGGDRNGCGHGNTGYINVFYYEKK